MKHHKILGGGGLRLHVIEAGDPAGPPILFLHGFSQCRLSFEKQFESDLVEDFRLVAMDLRGHGRSEKPVGVYSESKLWADDVHAVIETLGLDHPVVVGHAHSGLVIADYLRFYGDGDLGGIHLVSAVTKIGTPAARAVTDYFYKRAEFQSMVPRLFSSQMDKDNKFEEFMRTCTDAESSLTDFYFFFGINSMVPPYVLDSLYSRTLDNDDVLRRIAKPTLITHGYRDLIVLPQAAQQHARIIPHAKLSLHRGVGHVPHWEIAHSFNRELREFAW